MGTESSGLRGFRGRRAPGPDGFRRGSPAPIHRASARKRIPLRGAHSLDRPLDRLGALRGWTPRLPRLHAWRPGQSSAKKGVAKKVPIAGAGNFLCPPFFCQMAWWFVPNPQPRQLSRLPRPVRRLVRRLVRRRLGEGGRRDLSAAFIMKQSSGNIVPR